MNTAVGLKKKPSFKASLGILAVLLSGMVWPLESFAQETVAAVAMNLFKKKEYARAAVVFGQAYSQTLDPELLYYRALAQQYAKDFAGAKTTYKTIATMYPGTKAAEYSVKALMAFGPERPRRAQLPPQPPPRPTTGSRPAGTTAGSSSAASSASRVVARQESNSTARQRPGLDTFPDDCRVYFQNQGNLLIIDAYVNGRPQKMIFDTGAEAISFGRNHLENLGIRGPSGKPTGASEGVGDGGAQDSWDMNADIRVGSIERKQFHISVQDSMNVMPLLGQTFFDAFTYTIDNGAKCIHFVRKSREGGSIYADPLKDPNNVPFTREGKELVVRVLVNGKPTQFYFDTGAEGVLVSEKQCQALGIVIPEDAEVGTSQGIAGTTTARIFDIDRMQMGPIDRSKISVHTVSGYKMSKGLLGQEFFKNWQYTIDYNRSLIMFKRR